MARPSASCRRGLRSAGALWPVGATAAVDVGRDRRRGERRLSRRGPRPRARWRGDDGDDLSGPTRDGLAVVGADGRPPRRLVQLGLVGQQRRAERRPHRARMAEPGRGPASEPGRRSEVAARRRRRDRRTEPVDRGHRGAEPHPGAADELRGALRPRFRSVVRSDTTGVRRGHLGVSICGRRPAAGRAW
jgi:hypothetical protein